MVGLAVTNGQVNIELVVDSWVQVVGVNGGVKNYWVYDSVDE